MRFVRQLAKLSLWLVLIALAIPLALIAVLQVSTGRDVISKAVSDLASTTDRRVTIDGLHIGFDLDVSIDAVAVSDVGGDWLRLKDISANWRPGRLFAGVLDLTEIDVADVIVLREPVTGISSTSEPENTNEPSFLPGLAIRLDALTLDQLTFGAGLVGENVTVSVAGAAALSADPREMSGTLSIDRIDGTSGGIRASLRFFPEAETLSIDLKVQEPRGGLVARLFEIADLPALDIDLSGDGPLERWNASLRVALDGRETVTGTAAIASSDTRRTLTFDLDGSLEPLSPPVAAAFFLGTTDLTGEAEFSDSFQPISGQLSLSTQTVKLEASGSLDPQSQKLKADLSISIAAGDDAQIALDLVDRRIAFGPIAANATISGALTKADWRADLSSRTLHTTELTVSDVSVSLSGQGADLRPESLKSQIKFSAEFKGVQSKTAEIRIVDGDTAITGSGAFDRATETLTLEQFDILAPPANLHLAKARVAASQIDASGALTTKDISVFSDLSGRSLGGAVTANFSITGNPQKQTAEINLDLNASDLSAGIPTLDGLLGGASKLKAVVQVDGFDVIRLTEMTLASPALSATGSASLINNEITSDLRGSLLNLAKINPELAGEISFQASANGQTNAPSFSADLSSDRILLSGTPLTKLELSASGTASASNPQGLLKANATLKGAPLSLSANVESRDGGAHADTLEIRLGENSILGNFSIKDLNNAPESLEGQLNINAPNLADFSPLLLTEIGGDLTGEVVASSKGAGDLQIRLQGKALKGPDVDIDALMATAAITSPFNTPQIDGEVELTGIIATATPIHKLKLTAKGEANATDLTVDVRLTEGQNADGVFLSAQFVPRGNSLEFNLRDLDGRYQGLRTTLVQPANISYANGLVAIDGVALRLGDGSLSINGSAGEVLDIKASFKDVPLTLANAFAPGLGLGGQLSGRVDANGSASAPKASWKISGSGLTASALRGNGISALGLQSEGTFQNGQIVQQTNISNADGLSASAKGTVAAAAPQSLNLQVSGDIPLAAFRRKLTEAGFRASGNIALGGTVTGSTGAPQYALEAVPRNISLTELSTGLTLQEVGGRVDVTPQNVSINALKGNFASGGSMSVGGTVGLGNGLPADLRARVIGARYIDPGLVTALVGADLTVKGALAGTGPSALVAGTINIQKADVTIPESLPGSVSPLLVQHVNASKAVKQQVAELGGGPSQSQQDDGANPLRLDVTISAPGRIFIRGRGLDAELYGDLKLAGTTNNPVAVGAFTLKRGQLDILTRRLSFSRGSATFYGSFTPTVDFLATTTVDSTQINVSVEGSADDPVIAFSSVPELPQDETLALLLFGKSVGTLSPTQIARLAAAVATLTGGNDTGPLSQLRKSLGLDAIDINTDGDDGPSVAVGKYINDNIYLGVEQGTGTGSSRVKVDIDLDKGIKVRGEVGADGSSKAGIFFEREY